MSFGKTNYRNGGTRGGADQFKWDDVKNDKYRENYLGNSVNAPVGRWQKDKDLTWYTKLSKADRSAALQEELALAKQRDQDLMNQALGIALKRRVEPTGPLDANEMKELLKRGASNREGLDAERVEGLGAAPVPEGFEARPKKTLAEKYQESMAKGGGEDNIHALPGAAVRDDDERARKKAAKKEKKEKKKEKKERKKEKKASKQRRETDDRSEARYERKRGRSMSSDRGRRSSRRSYSPSPSRSRSRSRSFSRSREVSRRSRSSSREYRLRRRLRSLPRRQSRYSRSPSPSYRRRSRSGSRSRRR